MTRAASSTTSFDANPGGERSSPKRSDLRSIEAMLDVARTIWPNKTAAHLASATGVTERAAQFWLAGETGMTLAAARALIRSKHGYEFLVPFVGDDCDALWFRRAKLAHDVGVTARAIRAQERRIEQLRQKREQLELNLD